MLGSNNLLTLVVGIVLSLSTVTTRSRFGRGGGGIVVVVGKGDATHPVIISVSKDLTSQYQAGTLLKDFAQILGGKGGGRPDFAQGAGEDLTLVSQAFKKAESLVGL